MSPSEFQAEMRKKAANVKTDIGRAMVNSCELVSRTAKSGMEHTQIDESKSYPRQSGNKVHHPSVEGAYPAVDYSHLMPSITYNIEDEGGQIVGRVGSPIVYAAYTEFGTSKMSARPWLKPSIEKNREKIHELFRKAGSGVDIGEVETGE